MKIGILVKPYISEINYKVIRSIGEDERFKISLAIIDCRPVLSFKKKVIRNIKRGRGGYILIMGFNKLFRKKDRNYNIRKICETFDIEMIETPSPYSAKTISEIRKRDLDILLLINGFGIIRKELLGVTPRGILSYHHGNMRKYRGMPPAFWELYNNEREIGITVQKLATGLDCGIAIAEKSVKIRRVDNLNTLNSRIYDEGIDLMHSALVREMDPEFVPERISSYGQIYTLPNLRQWIILKLKLLVRKISVFS